MQDRFNFLRIFLTKSFLLRFLLVSLSNICFPECFADRCSHVDSLKALPVPKSKNIRTKINVKFIFGDIIKHCITTKNDHNREFKYLFELSKIGPLIHITCPTFVNYFIQFRMAMTWSF